MKFKVKPWFFLIIFFCIINISLYNSYFSSHSENKDQFFDTLSIVNLSKINLKKREPSSLHLHDDKMIDKLKLPENDLSSLQLINNYKVNEKSYNEYVKFDCRFISKQLDTIKDKYEFSYEYKVKSSNIVFQLVNCTDPIKKKMNFTLVNITNGYLAQLFNLSSSDIKSDFIQLKNGINILNLNVNSADGQKKIISIKINRF